MSALLEPLGTRSRFEAALAPAMRTASENGPTVDLLDCDGPVMALVQLGEVGEEMTLDVAFQESANGTTWTDIADSAVPDLAADSLLLHTFVLTKRYLRCQLALDGDTPTVTLGVLVGQVCKVF